MKEVTLLATGPSYTECPFETEELWGVAPCLIKDDLKDRKFTKVFAFDSTDPLVINDHPPRVLEDFVRSLDIARQKNIPIVSLQDYATEKYPIKELVAKLKSSYFMPTISYMLAYAIYLEYEKIHIYGIDAGPQWMYQAGKPNIVFWIGYAVGKGLELKIGWGSLKWCYQPGLDSMPVAFLKEEYEKFFDMRFNVRIDK